MTQKHSNLKRVVGTATIATIMTVGQVVNADSVDETQPLTNQPETTEISLTQDQKIAKAQQDVDTANQEVSTATEVANGTSQEASQATELVNQAGVEANQANQGVKVAEQNVTVAEETDAQAQTEVVNATETVNQAQTQASEASQNLTTIQADTASQAIQLKEEVDKASDTITTTTTEVVKEADATADTTAYKAKYPNTPQEDVKYSGTAVEDVTLTAEQSKELSETGSFTYTPDVKAINQHFNGYVAQLRQLNGIEIPSTSYSDQAQAYADARIQELLASTDKDYLGLPKLSHKTNLGDERTFENIIAPTYKFSTDSTDPNTVRVLSDKEFAYRLALGWFSDYGNVSSGGYGHRDALLFGASDSQALSIGSVDYQPFAGISRTRYYIVSVGIDEEGKDTYEQYAQIASNMRLYNVAVDSETNAYTLNGKSVVFLPQTTFNYIATITKTEPSSAKADAQEKYVAYLAQAQQLVAQAQAKSDEANANLSTANVNLAKAQATAIQTAQQVTEARQKLAQLVANANEKNNAYTQAKAVLSEAEAKHADALESLAKAKDKQAKAVETLKSLTGEDVTVPVVPQPVNPDTPTPQPQPAEPVTPTPIVPIDNPTTPTPLPNQNPIVIIGTDTDGKTNVKIIDPQTEPKPISEPVVTVDDNKDNGKIKVNFGGVTIDVDGVATEVKSKAGEMAKEVANAVSGGFGSSIVKADEKTNKVSEEKTDTAESSEQVFEDVTEGASKAIGKTTKEIGKKVASNLKKNQKETSKEKGTNTVGYWVAGIFVASLAGLGIYKGARKSDIPTSGSDTTVE